MLVMSWDVFKAQGRIMKSTKVWREEALQKGSLLEHRADSGQVAIFVSQMWWDREHTDESNSPGAPDYQSSLMIHPAADAPKWKRFEPYERKDLKWRVICAGVTELLEQEEQLDEQSLVLWLDWQSLPQDDPEERRKGARSLLAYATRCTYMLVPTEEHELRGIATPEKIPGYGARAWCRLEYFVFSLWAEMRGREARLYAVQRDGTLRHFPEVGMAEKHMPSGGALSDAADLELITALEERIIDAYGHAIVEIQCRCARDGEIVDLYSKLLRPAHIDSLMAAVEKHQIARLDLYGNQLGAQGAAKLAVALKTNTTVTKICLAGNGFNDADKQALLAATASCQHLELHL